MTAFCLLTLARATASTGIPSIPGRFDHRWTSAGTGGDLGITATGAPLVRVVLADVGADAVARLAWPGEPRPRIAEVRWFLDGRPVGDALVEGADAPGAPARGGVPPFVATLALDGNGDHEVRAVARVVPAGGDATNTVELASAPLALRVRGLVDAAVERQMEFVRRAARTAPEAFEVVTSSSAENDAEYAPVRAFDRSESTRWVSKAADARPTIRASWRKPVQVSEIRLLPALHAGRLGEGSGFDVPRRVAVLLNGVEERIVEMGAAQMLSGATLALDRPLSLRRIEVRVDARDPGTQDPGRVGWREIQLLGPQ